MSTKWDVNRAVRGSDLPSPSRLIMLTLSDMADVQSCEVPPERGPSLSELAAETGLGTATVKRHLSLLEKEGWVARDRPPLVAARTEHARTTYRLAVGGKARRLGAVARSEPGVARNGPCLDGRGMATLARLEPRHGSQRAMGTAQREPVPFTHDRLKIEKTKPVRADVERICRHLADLMEANGSLRPVIGKRWREAARLLLDRDGRTVEQVMKAIDWCQADSFWRANIRSMPKLREKYDTLRLQAMREIGRQRQEHNGLRLNPATVARLEDRQRFVAMDRAAAVGIVGVAIEGRA